MRVLVVTPPAPIVTWEEADARLKLDGDETQRPELEAFIAAATGHLDGPSGWLGRSLGTQTLEARFDLAACDRSLMLPYGPVLELLSVRFLASAGEEQEAELADFDLLGDELAPAYSVFPWDGGSLRREAGRIRYRAGYETVPEPIKAAILLMVGDLHRFRTTASDMSMTTSAIPMSLPVAALLRPFRVYR